jgi:hypothetical protein
VKRAWSDWISSAFPEDLDSFFVTLTLKQSIRRTDGTFEALTAETADNELLFLQKRLNQRVFGNASKRSGKALRWIDVSEGDGRLEKRVHRHIRIEKPSFLTDAEFEELFRDVWSRSRWSMDQIHIERARSGEAVSHYMLKTGADSICTETLSLGIKAR